MDVDKTISEREQIHGDFETHSSISQSLKTTAHFGRKWQSLQPDAREAVDMILHKVARIVNGGAEYADHWHDIQGYARLVEKRLTRDKG